MKIQYSFMILNTEIYNDVDFRRKSYFSSYWMIFTNIPHCVCVFVCVCALQRHIIVWLPTAPQGVSLHFQSVRSMLTREEFDEKKWSSIGGTLCWLSVLVTLDCASILLLKSLLVHACMPVELTVYRGRRRKAFPAALHTYAYMHTLDFLNTDIAQKDQE